MPSRGTFGYVRVYQPEHPRSNAGYVLEHILVVEAALGHFLPATAEVHHVDGARSNNAPNNLVACQDGDYHKLLHQRQRAFDACGNASAHRCKYCKKYDRQEEITVSRGNSAYHRSCHTSYRRSRRPQ